MKKSYLLGIDIGTSACKVAVFDREGRVLAAAMVLIRYIIRMRDGQSRILKNGGAQSARQQRKQYRKLESHRKKSPEWELTDRAGRQSQ